MRSRKTDGATADSKNAPVLLRFDGRLRLFRFRRFHVLSSCKKSEMSNGEPSASVLHGIPCIGGLHIKFRFDEENGSLTESRKIMGATLPAAFLFYFDVQAADFLVQGGERHVEALGGFGLVPVAAFQHVGDDAALQVFHDFE